MPSRDLTRNKKLYRKFIDILNAQAFEELPDVVDPDRYREVCVGFTPGQVNLDEAIVSFKRVLSGIPDLNATIEEVVAEGDRVSARLTVSGTHTGSLFGMPATHRHYAVNMFDTVTIKKGKIVDRIQQTDTLGQFLTLFRQRILLSAILILFLILALLVALVVK